MDIRNHNAEFGHSLGQTAPFNEAPEERWYAAHTSANHEKSVASQLRVREVEHFLPTYSSIRHWKDRRVTLERPLFPGYLFVRMALCDRLRVLQTPGVARLVGFNGVPTPLPQEDIEGVRKGLVSGIRVEPHVFLTVGRRVRVCTGPLDGMKGIIVRRKNGSRLVISLESIRRAMAVDMDSEDVMSID